MKEMKAFPNRKWVIKAAVGFLAVMLLLTFFSNTIMNYSLPQVTLVYASWGTMSSSITGTGTVEAFTQAKVTAAGTRKIDTVNFGVNEDVVKGDIIATLVPATEEEKEELKTAQAALDALLQQKVISDLQKPVYDYTSFEQSISDAQEVLNEAKTNLAAAQGKDAAVNAAQSEVNSIQSQIDRINNDLLVLNTENTAKAQTVGDAQDNLNSAQIALDAKIAAGEDYTAEQEAVRQAQTALDQANADLAPVTKAISDKNAALVSAQKSLDAANVKLSTAQALPSVKDAEASLKGAQRSYDAAVKSLADQKKADGIAQQIDAMTEKDKQKEIADAQKKVDDLTALAGEAAVTAPADGRISSINISNGSETTKGDILVVVDVTADGYKVPITFTSAQTSQMQVGMGARLDYGTEEDAVIVSIKPDGTDPRNKKIVTFKLNDPNNWYWFATGQSVTLSLNNRSQDYTCVVPLSAVHEESGETFVYTVKTKSSPLGDRYIAVKVPVTILAKDDTNAALDPAALGEYSASVITETNDKSFKSGDQVRLAES